jgi:hypothetical protein
MFAAENSSLLHRRIKAKSATIRVNYTKAPQNKPFCAAGGALMVAMAAFVATGIAFLMTPPAPTTSVGPFEIPDDAKCLRATRYADYATGARRARPRARAPARPQRPRARAQSS